MNKPHLTFLVTGFLISAMVHPLVAAEHKEIEKEARHLCSELQAANADILVLRVKTSKTVGVGTYPDSLPTKKAQARVL